MVPFAGFNMPVRYSSDNEEHKAVRESVGVFDVSHMGEFLVKGENALDLLQYVTSNDVSILTDGKVQYACLPNDAGGIVDDLLVYRWSATEYYLVVNASNIEKDWNWISKHNTFGAELVNISDETSLLAVQGPKAVATLQKLTKVDLSAIPYYTFTSGELAGIPDVIISNTGYTGAGGFELFVPNEYVRQLWDAVFEAGKEFNIKPIGLGARDTLRLEKGYCLYGNDIDDTTSPIEAGLGWVTKFSKKFINSENLAKQKESGVKKKLVGFKTIERGIPRSHYVITSPDGTKIGDVTSGTQSPSLGIGIGLGYVNSEFSKVGSSISIVIRDQQIKAEVIKLPFL
jgi:aminomethyltransferase